MNQNLMMVYLIFGNESCLDTHKLHFQAFVKHKNRVYISADNKDFSGSYIERTQGTMEVNLSYCSKDGKFKEFEEHSTSTGRDNVFKVVWSTFAQFLPFVIRVMIFL